MLVLEYHPRWVRVVVAIIASLFILFYGRPLDLVRSFGSMQFYPVFVISTLVSFAMLEMTHQFTIWLDRRDPWTYQWQERALLQFTLGVQVPLLFDVFLFSVYFAYYDIEITQNGFFSKDFPLIASFMCLVNGSYVVRFYFAYAKSKDEVLSLETDIVKVEGVNCSDLIRIENNGILVNLNLSADALYFYRDKKNVKVKTSKGNDYPVPYSLSQIVECYSEMGFCQINRGTIINLKIVKGYIVGSKRDTLELLVKADFDVYLANFSDRLIVTKDNIDIFKHQLGV